MLAFDWLNASFYIAMLITAGAVFALYYTENLSWIILIIVCINFGWQARITYLIDRRDRQWNHIIVQNEVDHIFDNAAEDRCIIKDLRTQDTIILANVEKALEVCHR